MKVPIGSALGVLPTVQGTITPFVIVFWILAFEFYMSDDFFGFRFSIFVSVTTLSVRDLANIHLKLDFWLFLSMMTTFSAFCVSTVFVGDALCR